MHWLEFLPHTAQPVEVFWFVIGLGGLCFSGPALGEFTRDYRILKHDGVNGGDMILARLYLGIGILQVSKHSLITLLGIVAMCIPPSPGLGSRSISPTGLVVTVGLLIVAMLSAGTSMWLKYSRLKLFNYLRQKAGTTRITKIIPQEEHA